MKVYQVDPTQDARWPQFIEKHPKASVFHTKAWLLALRRTYGYEPVAFTTSTPGEELKNAVVFCRINSWLTGRRLVSLPFSDHCEPLCESWKDAKVLLGHLQTERAHQEWKYLEVRPTNSDLSQIYPEIGFSAVATYFLHVVDLRPDLDTVFRSFDNDSVRRRVQRAERAGLVEKFGRSDEVLRDFYDLFVLTRRRHRLPPIPYAWFQNLIKFLGDALGIRLAYKDGIPIAAILTLSSRDVAIYKYGCSNTQFHRYGATPWLLWRAIAAAKSTGAKSFDLGRTDEDNAGLLAFKNNWASQAKRLVYWRFPDEPSLISVEGWKLKTAKRVFSYMPNSLLRVAGKLIYRHIG